MGFNSVYRTLQDIFPEVDSRLLRAVAIEHPKDATAAVEVVLEEIIPNLPKLSTISSSSKENGVLLSPTKESVTVVQPVSTTPVELEQHIDFQNETTFYDAIGEDDYDCGDDDLVSLEKRRNNGKSICDMSSFSPSSSSVQGSVGNYGKGFANCEDSDVMLMWKDQPSKAESSDSIENVQSSNAMKYRESETLESTNGHLDADLEDLSHSSPNIHEFFHENVLSTVDYSSETRSLQLAEATFQGNLLSDPESSFQIVPEPETRTTDTDPKFSLDAASKEGTCTSEMSNVKDESPNNSLVIRSGHTCTIDMLEEIINFARDNKKALVSAIDSTITQMREVELREEAAEKAKEEAARGGADILAKVNELKQALEHAKEANDMHAGEVYAEKAILATEMKELQHRLLSLSDERDKSLGFLDEMCEALKARLTVAEKEIEAAGQEKQEKETYAREALAYQELAMEKLVQESKMLKQVAEENSKLQDFLMDRGRVVDILQGEISVKCQDVKLLKDRFDRGILLSRSLCSSLTSNLASSNSSLRSIPASQQTSSPAPGLSDSHETIKSSEDLAYENIITTNGEMNYSIESLKSSSRASSIDYNLSTGEHKGTEDYHKAFVDEGWEFFDKSEGEYFKS